MLIAGDQLKGPMLTNRQTTENNIRPDAKVFEAASGVTFPEGSVAENNGY